MDMLRRIVFSLVALIVVGAAAYYILKQDRIFDIIIPQGALGDKVRAVINPAREKIISTTDSVVEVVKQKAQGIIDEITGAMKQKAFDSLKTTVNQKLNDVGKSFGVPSAPPSGGAMVLDSASAVAGTNDVPLGFSVKKGQSAVFVLKDTTGASGNVPYTIAWGDGKTEGGTLADKEVKTISHTWAAAGEYAIDITMTVGETTKTYHVYIIVYA